MISDDGCVAGDEGLAEKGVITGKWTAGRVDSAFPINCAEQVALWPILRRMEEAMSGLVWAGGVG